MRHMKVKAVYRRGPMKTFLIKQFKISALFIAFFFAATVSQVLAQTETGVASYYYSDCSSTFYCTGVSFPGCTNSGTIPNSPSQYIVAMNSTDLGSLVACNACLQITD